MITDTHCHLAESVYEEVGDVIKRAIESGVGRMIVPATSERDFLKIEELTKKYDEVYGLLGVHPENKEGVKTDEILTAIRDLTKQNKKIVGIGEIGLDGYHEGNKIEEQKELFVAQMKLARELNLPAAIHSRAAETEMKQVLEEMAELPKGQFHCFGESEAFLDYVLERGFYVSYCGNITYKKTDHLKNLLARTPRNRLLLETDSPFLSPEGKRGTTNEPANLMITAKVIADLLGIELVELETITEENTKCLYSNI